MRQAALDLQNAPFVYFQLHNHRDSLLEREREFIEI